MIGHLRLAAVLAAPFWLATTTLSSAQAQTQAPRSPELEALDAQLPGTLINDPTRLDWTPVGAVQARNIRAADIPGGGAATRYTVRQAGAHAYDIGVNIPVTAGIANGDVVTVGFYARTISSSAPGGMGLIGVRLQQDAAPWPGFLDRTVQVGNAWKWHEVSGTSRVTIANGQAVVQMQIAGAVQVIEIGQAIVVKGAPSILAAAAPAAPVASPLPPTLVGVGTLLNNPDDRVWQGYGPAGSRQDTQDRNVFTGRATRFTVTAPGATPYAIGANVPITGPIAVGDRLTIAVAARTLSAETADGRGVVVIRVQGRNPPYDGFADNRLIVGPNWQLLRLTTTATKAFAAGDASFALHMASARQTVEIGPVYIIKMP